MADHIAKYINAYLADATDKPITVAWDGNIITRDEPATFAVFAGEESTDFWIIDRPYGLALHFDNGRHGSFDEIDTVTTYAQLAKLLAEVVAVPEGENA